MKTIVVNVTEEDIKQGRQKDESECPIALAVRRTLTFDKVMVTQSAILGWKIGESRFSALTPRRAKRFIVDFDLGRRPQPFKFKLKAA